MRIPVTAEEEKKSVFPQSINENDTSSLYTNELVITCMLVFSLLPDI